MKHVSSQGSALWIDKRQHCHNASSLHSVGEVTLLLGSQACESTGQDLATLGYEFLEQINILVINGITRLDR